MNKNTGGPAFPTEKSIGTNKDGTWIAEVPGKEGMTLRDYFAAKALQGFLANPTPFEQVAGDKTTADTYAAEAYVYADAMLKAREQNESTN